MAGSVAIPTATAQAPAESPDAAARPRHSALVRVTHWIATLCTLALLVTGVEILISHPRFYWGEVGNPNTEALFTLPIPASRPYVNTGYDYVLRDQNGWSRSLHFQSAWILVFTGLLYVFSGLFNGYFRRSLVPTRADLNWRSLSKVIVEHLRFRRPGADEAWSYNTLQRLAYLGVIFVLFPLMIWTGLAMSPAITSVVPDIATVFGGRQSARTIHFLATGAVVGFLAAHVLMVCLAGFRTRMRAMITGRVESSKEAS